MVKGSYVGQKLGRGDCKLDPKNPCMAVCNDTVRIDISKLFPYPWVISIKGKTTLFLCMTTGWPLLEKEETTSFLVLVLGTLVVIRTVVWVLLLNFML